MPEKIMLLSNPACQLAYSKSRLKMWSAMQQRRAKCPLPSLFHGLWLFSSIFKQKWEMGFLVQMLTHCLQPNTQTQRHICFISNAPAPLQAAAKEISWAVCVAPKKSGFRAHHITARLNMQNWVKLPSSSRAPLREWEFSAEGMKGWTKMYISNCANIQSYWKATEMLLDKKIAKSWWFLDCKHC